MVRELPLYIHAGDICPFGQFAPIRQHYFFSQHVAPVSRGVYGWRVAFDVHLSIVVPSQFAERFWLSKIAIDVVFPLDAELHAWLGGWVRMHGLLFMQGSRFNRRAGVETEWEPLSEDMAGLHTHISTPTWHWRIRVSPGPRFDIAWREAALQLSVVEPWDVLEEPAETLAVASAETHSLFPDVEPLRRTTHRVPLPCRPQHRPLLAAYQWLDSQPPGRLESRPFFHACHA